MRQPRLKRAPGRDLELMKAAEERLTARLVGFFGATARHASRQISERLAREAIGKSTDGRIRRDAFLYLDPTGEYFAQCGTCGLFRPELETCGIVQGHIVAAGSCGLYAKGQPNDDQPQRAQVGQTAAGYVVRQVRCENCAHYDVEPSECGLFRELDEKMPEVFDLDASVAAHGCCNAQTPIQLTPSGRGSLQHLYENNNQSADDNQYGYIAPSHISEPVHKSSDHLGGANLHVEPQNAVPIYNIPIADAVTNANVLHVFVEMVRDGKTQTRRVIVPMDSLIALQRVVDQTRVDKHERQLCETGETEPGQRPPLVLLWDDDNIILGGHHGLQAARNLGVTEVEVDLLVAPE